MIIGIAGPSASGKTTVAHLLEKEYSAIRMRYSSILSDIARSQGLDPEDKLVLQDLYMKESKSRGEDFLNEEMKSGVSLLHPDILVIEGNRRMNDIAMLQELAKERKETLLLIYLDASPKVRLERYNERLRKAGYDEIDEEQLEERETDHTQDELESIKELIQKEGLYIQTDTYSENETMSLIKNEIGSLKKD